MASASMASASASASALSCNSAKKNLFPFPHPHPHLHFCSLPTTKFLLNQNVFLKFQVGCHPDNSSKRIRITRKRIACLSGRRIALSDVMVKETRPLILGKQWHMTDLASIAVIGAMHGLCVMAPFTCNAKAVGLFMGLYFVTGLLGITLCYHRYLSHRSFRIPKWLEYVFAYCGVQALQGSPMDWVSTHRYHHQYCDSERDPHSPRKGFWYSHMNWLFDRRYLLHKVGSRSNVADLEKQFFYRFLDKTYILHPLALGAILYAIGDLPFLVWGMAVRVVWVFHITWLVNSACHIWGFQSWNTKDLSKNNWWVAALSWGEGWHNNHHAFEFSARHGLEWWQFDPTWYVIKLLEFVGLAKDVRYPLKQHRQKFSS